MMSEAAAGPAAGGATATGTVQAPPPEDSRADARIFDTKHVFFDPVNMEPDGWPKESAKHEATLTGCVARDARWATSAALSVFEPHILRASQ